MTDSEKLKLISDMIGDFWQYSDQTEKIGDRALTMLDAIGSVIEFRMGNTAKADEPHDDA